VTLHLTFPAEKLRKIQQLEHHLFCQQKVSVQDIRSKVCGESFRINKSNTASSLALQNTAVSDKLSGTGEPESNRIGIGEIQCPTKEAKSNLTWWISLDRKIPIQSVILPRVPSTTKELDASGKGWRARQSKLSTGVRWSLEESMYHFDFLSYYLPPWHCRALPSTVAV